MLDLYSQKQKRIQNDIIIYGWEHAQKRSNIDTCEHTYRTRPESS